MNLCKNLSIILLLLCFSIYCPPCIAMEEVSEIKQASKPIHQEGLNENLKKKKVESKRHKFEKSRDNGTCETQVKQYTNLNFTIRSTGQLSTVSQEVSSSVEEITKDQWPTVSQEASSSLKEDIGLLRSEEASKIEVSNLLPSLSYRKNSFSEGIKKSLESLSEEALELQVIRPSSRRTSKNTKLLKAQKIHGNQNSNYLGIISQSFSKTNMK